MLAAGGTEDEWEANRERLVLEELERDTVQRANRAKAQVRGELSRALF